MIISSRAALLASGVEQRALAEELTCEGCLCAARSAQPSLPTQHCTGGEGGLIHRLPEGWDQPVLLLGSQSVCCQEFMRRICELQRQTSITSFHASNSYSSIKEMLKVSSVNPVFHTGIVPMNIPLLD